mgnify:CR=1 FL=1
MKRRSTGQWVRYVALLCVLIVLFAQMLCAATELSATVDEGFHLTSGYEYLRTGRVHLFDEHAPLAKALFSWPLYLVPDLVPPEAAAGYADGDLIAVAQETTLAYRPLDRVIVAPRVAAALIAWLFAALLYRAARTVTGPIAGLVAVALCAFDPNFVAHGSLLTTDMGAAVFSFVAIWSGSLWLERPTRLRWWIAALLLGLAQSAKLTALLIYPVLAIGVLGAIVDASRAEPAERGPEGDPGSRWNWRIAGERALGYVGMVGVSLLVLWALYGFELRPVDGVLGGQLPIPAASHVERWVRLQDNLAYGRESFLLGQNSMSGWVLYFPIAFLTKTPLPLLLMLAWALAKWVWRQTTPSSRTERGWESLVRTSPMVVFPIIYGFASLASRLNIGYRHLLPVLPFLYIGAAYAVVPGPETNRTGSGRVTLSRRVGREKVAHLVAAGLIAWMAFGALSIAPDGLAFFNELAGGPANGWRLLADSNTDWGQTFKALAAFQQESDLGTVKLSAFTFYDPAAYGVDYEPISPMPGAPEVLPRRFNPAGGIYAISATTLDGVPLADPAMFDWFRHRAPYARVGQVMLLFDVQPLAGEWIAQCSVPAPPLTAVAIDEGLGVPGLRRIAFDCERSWIVPGGGAAPGWYALAIPEQTRLRWHGSAESNTEYLPEWVAALPVEGLALGYVQPRNSALPAFALWECAGCGLPASQSLTDVGGVIAFRGLSAPSVVKAGETVEVLTAWEIVASPNRPISLMLHLSGDDGIPVAVGDALGYPVEQWQPGDQLVQRHRLELSEAVSPGVYTLRTGAYWLDDLSPLTSKPLTAQMRVE